MPPAPASSLAQAQAPRGVVMTVVRTLLFHILSMLYGVLLLVSLALTAGGLGLVLLCLFSASTRTSRLFVAWLWRNELWINGLVGEKQTETERFSQERERGLRREASQQMPRGYAALPTNDPATTRPSSTRGREVTGAVMTFSVLYFLVFKGLFNIIFAAVPLILWTLVAIHIVPSWAPDPNMVMADDTTNRVFVALATSFFAYQIGIAAANGSVFISEKVQELLFHRNSAAAVRSPLLATQSFRYGDNLEYQTMQHDRSLPQIFMEENRYGEELRPRGHERPPRPLSLRSGTFSSSGGSSSAPPAPPAPAAPPAPPAPPPFGEIPPLPPIPPFPPYGTVPGDSRQRGRHLEDAFRAQDGTHEAEFCGIKVKIQMHPSESTRTAGRGRGSLRGFGHRGGRGGGGGGGDSRGGLMDRGVSRGFDEELPFGSVVPPYGYNDSTQEMYVHVVDDDHVGSHAHPAVSPVFGRSSSSSSRNQRRGRMGGGRHRRSDSFDSGQPGGGRYTPDFDLKHGAHTRLWEALDLRPSAPGLPDEYPVARPAGLYSPSHQAPSMGALQKSWSDSGRQHPYGQQDAGDTSEGSRKLGLFAAKQMLKEQSRQLKHTAKQLKREYKEQAKLEALAHKEQARQNALMQAREQERQMRDQARIMKQEERQRHQAGIQLIQEERQRHQAKMQLKQGILRTQSVSFRRDSGSNRDAMEAQALRALDGQRKYQAAADDLDEDKQEPLRLGEFDESSALEHEHAVKTRDEYAMDIENAAQEEVERQRRELELEARADESPYSVPRVLHSDSGSSRDGRVRGRRAANSTDQIVEFPSSRADDTLQVRSGRASSRTISYVTAHQSGTLSDREIRAYTHYDSLSRSVDEADTMALGQFGGISFSSSPAIIRALDTGPVYRSTHTNGTPEYNAFSPLTSPSNSFITNSFIESQPKYDLLSPTNTIHDADFPSEEFQQVYRSIRYTDDNRVVPSQLSSLPHYEDVPGARDKVHFCSFAPPSVYPSKQSFRYAVWAFLLNQRQEMREQAETADPEARQLSLDTKMVVRRGALVHVTLEVPEGFKILNGATQGFAWEGKVSSVNYDIQCTDNADFGQVLFKASIVVGTEVAVLRSYVIVSSRKLEPSDLDAHLLDSKLEVLEMTYQEIPYPTLELKELVGRGYFGDAYRASYQGEDVVVKTIRASEFGETNDQILKEFQHEAAVLSMFGYHPCVVPFVGASTDMRYPLSLITKYLPFGSLEDNLKKPEIENDLSIRQRTLMLKDAAAGLLNIHEGGFIHRDVAARNCLVDQNLRVKICDFGLCRRVNAYGGSLMKDSVGPIKYMAPESLQPPHSFSYDSDSWMFGVLMWETYTAKPPFQTKTPLEAGMSVLNGERLSTPAGLPADLQSLMESCFHESPSQRPSMAEILTALDDAASPPTQVRKAASASSNGARGLLAMGGELEQRNHPIWV